MKAWENFLALQEIELGAETVAKWLRSLKVLRFDACNLYLEAKDSFQVLWFEEHIRQKVKTRLLNNNNKQIKVHIAVTNDVGIKREAVPNGEVNQAPPPPFRLNFDALQPALTFQQWYISHGNTLAAKVLAEAVGYDLDKQTLSSAYPLEPIFNPLYIYGEKGSGKTHLLTAAAHALRLRGKLVIYVRAETFTDHVVMAIRAGEMSTFRQAYRNADALIIDDAHIFSRKGATQEELFHTFNTLHLAKKLIILSANCPPSELQHIEPRLISRFEWGIALALENLSKLHLLEVLKRKAKLFSFELRPNIAEFLVDQFKSSVSSMRALEALILRTHLSKKTAHFSSTTLTESIVKHTLRDLILEEEHNALTPEKIIKAVAETYGITTEDVLSKSQSRDCTLPRQIAMHLCRYELNIPFIKIGDVFDRDHSTVMSSVRRIQKAIDSDDALIAPAYRSICNLLKSR